MTLIQCDNCAKQTPENDSGAWFAVIHDDATSDFCSVACLVAGAERIGT